MLCFSSVPFGRMLLGRRSQRRKEGPQANQPYLLKPFWLAGAWLLQPHSLYDVSQRSSRVPVLSSSPEGNYMHTACALDSVMSVASGIACG